MVNQFDGKNVIDNMKCLKFETRNSFPICACARSCMTLTTWERRLFSSAWALYAVIDAMSCAILARSSRNFAWCAASSKSMSSAAEDVATGASAGSTMSVHKPKYWIFQADSLLETMASTSLL